MKRIFILIFVLLPALVVSSCSFIGEDSASGSGVTSDGGTGNGGSSAIFDGKIVSVSEGFVLMAGTGSTAGLVTMSVSGKDLEDAEGNALSAGDLTAGMTVSIAYGGQIMESYPMQLGTPAKITVTGVEDDIVGFWMTVINDLWEVDPGLNSNISVIALDLTEAQNLSDGEKEAIVYLAGNEFGVQGISGTFDELCDMGYIDRDNLYFESGILVTLEVTGTGDGSFTFNAEKWRSGLGAYFYSDCTAIKGSSGWSYTVGSEAIS